MNSIRIPKESSKNPERTAMKQPNLVRIMNSPTPILFPPPEKIAHTFPIIIVTVVKSCDLVDNEATVDGPDNIIDNKSRSDNICLENRPFTHL